MDTEAGARVTARRSPRMGSYIAAVRFDDNGDVVYEQAGMSGTTDSGAGQSGSWLMENP